MNPKDIEGAKKVPLDLIPPAAKVFCAMALKHGAKKYQPFNWRDKKIQASKYKAACERHLDAWYDGEDEDDESGLNHLAHAIATLAILIDAMTSKKWIDDRPTPGATAVLIRKYTERNDSLPACGFATLKTGGK